LFGKLIKVKISHFVRNDNQHFGFRGLGGLKSRPPSPFIGLIKACHAERSEELSEAVSPKEI